MPNNSQKNQKPERTPEIVRFLAFKDDTGLTWEQISTQIGVSRRAILNQIAEGQLSGNVLRAVLQTYGISADWFLAGIGTKQPIESLNRAENGRLAHGIQVTDVDSADYSVRLRNAPDHDESVRPLFPFIADLDTASLQDFFYLTAGAIEQSLLLAGDRPGSDYTRRDLFNLALPFVLEKFKSGDLEITVYESGPWRKSSD